MIQSWSWIEHREKMRKRRKRKRRLSKHKELENIHLMLSSAYEYEDFIIVNDTHNDLRCGIFKSNLVFVFFYNIFPFIYALIASFFKRTKN